MQTQKTKPSNKRKGVRSVAAFDHKPTQMEAFDALYAIAAANGRGPALFGTSIEQARQAYEKTLIANSYPSAYFEFPLLGQACFDLLAVHKRIKPGCKFAPGAGFGYQPMIDWFADACIENKALGCGIELDLSAGETEHAGVYLQQRERTDLVEPFLASIGERKRAQSYLDALERMPPGWPAAYVGLFPGRPGTPLRIGGYMSTDEHQRCAKDPAHLAARFDAIGFSAYDPYMLERCTEFMQLAPSVDFQFDIFPDGSLSDTFGLSLSFNETKPRQAKECMESGYGAQVMEALERWGLADSRWHLIADAAFARHIPFVRDDGSEGRFALSVRFNYAKIKFSACTPKPAKFYLVLEACEIDL